MNTHCITDDKHTICVTDPAGVGAAFREALAHFCSGVVIVTATDVSGAPVGMTVGSFTSISMDPPLVGFFAGRNSTTLPHVIADGRFCVNVLSEDQDLLARTFARSGADKFAGTDWSPATNGSPRLAGAHAWIDCTLDQQQSIGDHDLVVGRVDALVVPQPNEPLVFHRSVFHGLRARA
ncbi:MULTISPECIES: flavin reductase family protein [Actinomycetes]|uniref:flavin reductase family protein n=1 Tax=Actinomycetes TaxID=1760 RepID=UPI0004C1D53B|nr:MULTISPECIES: flavin reductase family protein [Actinomycetes]